MLPAAIAVDVLIISAMGVGVNSHLKFLGGHSADKQQELSFDEIRAIADQARAMGCRGGFRSSRPVIEFLYCHKWYTIGLGTTRTTYRIESGLNEKRLNIIKMGSEY